jgi:outer membrane receptor protein involved in Fe transport
VIPNGPGDEHRGRAGRRQHSHDSAFQNAGKITAAQYDAQAVTYNAGIIDLFTEGYEAEFVANPTPNLTLRASYAYTERRRGNHYKEIHGYFDVKIPEWRAAAANDPALLTIVNREIATIESELDGQTTRQTAPFGTRPHKANLTGRYRFSQGWLKASFIGGSVRYQSKNFLQTDIATGRDFWGNESIFVDAFAGYRGRLGANKLAYTVQLNVTNVTNSYLAGVGRYNSTFDGMVRAYLNPPRTYRLTTTFEF